jgi:hypothetical protein
VTEQPMTRAERLELTKIVRQRAKLAKDEIAARQAQILADAEAALAARFKEEDAAWADITAHVRQYMAEIQEKINARCEEKGIPVNFRPGYAMAWLMRGENADPHRRAELRKVVQTQAEASAKAAKLEIDRQSVGIQEQLMAGGFETAEAREFLSSLPSATELMPALELPAIEGG